MTQHAFASFKQNQRKSWSLFAPLEPLTTLSAARLVDFAGVRIGEKILDVGCGTGVVALTAARFGAQIVGIDLCPDLVARAHGNARLAGVEATFLEGDVEGMPFEDATFDRVFSQFGHMFAPRPEVATAQMLRVLKPGGVLAFATWPPSEFVGQVFALVGRFAPLLEGVSPPTLWGDKDFIAQHLEGSVQDIVFEEGIMQFPALSLAHYRASAEATLGPLKSFVENPHTDPRDLHAFRTELQELASRYFEHNHMRQVYLMTRAVKGS
ncbi:MAG: SAM-dependent methyltransferase [Candidatus Puniceispirillum sp.]|nr:SAM-dependent methyltransferase [Candidatus Puniceispirillum sp.]